MKLIDCSIKCLCKPNLDSSQVYDLLGSIAGTCFNKEGGNKERLFERIMKQGHYSILEHINYTIQITCDRATANALVRHRHCAFTQESTIYTKYKDELTFINRPEPYKFSKQELKVLDIIETNYDMLVNCDKEPAGIARDILPNCLATKLTITTNLREWFYLITLRRDSKADSIRMHWVAQLLDAFFTEELKELWGAYEKR